MRQALPLLLALAVATPATAADRLAYGCGDVVVVARLENLDFEHVEIEDDFLGHGWAIARAHIRKVLKGHETRWVVPVRYFTHTYRRTDRDVRMVLSPGADGGYELRAVGKAGWRATPLAAACR